MEAPIVTRPPGRVTRYQPGYVTDYTENYHWDDFYKSEELNKDVRCEPLCGPGKPYVPSDCCISHEFAGKREPLEERVAPSICENGRNIGQFESSLYPCVYREMKVQKDDRDRYIDPYQDLITLADGRRLQYDCTHPDMMYGSQWSAELADPPGPYSFPTTTGLDPEIPWRKDLQWQVDGEVGKWPTDTWKTWTQDALCPQYGGHDDQEKYSQYKFSNKYP